jgi:hypothetical protein
MANAEKQWRRELKDRFIYTIARVIYWRTLRNQKKSHWNDYLEREQGREIWRAYNFTKLKKSEKFPNLWIAEGQWAITFTEKSKVLLEALFPDTPNTEFIQWEGYRESR